MATDQQVNELALQLMQENENLSLKQAKARAVKQLAANAEPQPAVKPVIDGDKVTFTLVKVADSVPPMFSAGPVLSSSLPLLLKTSDHPDMVTVGKFVSYDRDYRDFKKGDTFWELLTGARLYNVTDWAEI